MKQRLSLLTVFLFFLALIVSCQKDEYNPLLDNPDNADALATNTEVSTSYPTTPMELGKQLENPYALEAMQKAYNKVLIASPNLRGSVEKDTPLC